VPILGDQADRSDMFFRRSPQSQGPVPLLSTIDCGQRDIAIIAESSVCGVRPGNLLAEELHHLPLGKEALGLLGIGELERLEQESLGLKRGDHYHQDNNGCSLDRASSQKGAETNRERQTSIPWGAEMGKLTGKVAVVTGASKGIGARIAQELAAQGASVVVNYASSKEGADKVVADITKAGGKAIAVGGSVSKAEEIDKLFAETRKAFGKLDILVNNAGVYAFAPLEQITEEDITRMYATNVKGLLLATKAGVALFPQEGGTVINIGSVSSEQTPPMSVVYSGTKGAVDVITRVLAKELGPKKIRVNSVNPGPVATEGFKSSGVEGSDFEKQMVQSTPLGRVGTPEDIASVVAFLASEDAHWVTGSLIQVAGGMR
jgi:3-oxoacyl-[acyl-carrier protein] reductase